MPQIAELLRNGKPVEAHRPWPRAVVTADVWQGIANELAAGHAILLGLWGDNPPAVQMATMSDDGRQIAVATINCPGGSFPSVSAVHPPAIRLERAIYSLYGLEPMGAPDMRPWLDLGAWDVRYPLGARSAAPATRTAYAFLPVEGESLHRDSSRPRPRRDHRTRPLPFYRRWRNRGAARTAPWLCYKGVEIPHGGGNYRTRGTARRPYLGRQHCRLWYRLRARDRGGAQG